MISKMLKEQTVDNLGAFAWSHDWMKYELFIETLDQNVNVNVTVLS